MTENEAFAHLNDQLINRRRKLAELQEAELNAYGGRFDDVSSSQDVLANFVDDDELQQKARVAGRIVTFRKMGKSIFANIQDSGGRIQLLAQQDFMGNDEYARYKRLDLGDIVGIDGDLFRTRTGEVTIRVTSCTLLSKALRPLPEKWSGLKDIEIRYRQRYLDLLSNPKSRDVLVARTKIVREIRQYLDVRGYMEVETPMMQAIPGGAAARPFVTYYNALSTQMYMRIATELYLKQLLVGGFEKIFEINRNFRNEGLSKQHNPEFTCMELYHAYADARVMMDLIEGLVQHLAQAVMGSLKVEHEQTVDLTGPWRRVSYQELICERLGNGWFELSRAEKAAKAMEMGCHVDSKMNEGEITHEIYDKQIESTLIQPTFITRLPRELVPLAKACEDDSSLVDVYELIVNGHELSCGYSELNDPLEQRRRFEEQAQRTAGTEEEASSLIDEGFLTALEHGMPPAGGLGIGIDRLVMLLTGASTIRDVILFPHLKPRG